MAFSSLLPQNASFDFDRFSCFSEHLNRWKRDRPHGRAIVYGNTTLTWRYVAELSEQIQSCLQRNHAEAGSRVLVHLQEGPYLIASLAALEAIGAVYVPINIRFPEEQKTAIINITGAQFLLYDFSATKELIRFGSTVSSEPCPGLWLSALRRVVSEAVPGRSNPDLHRLERDFTIAVTSATTGASKAIVVNQFSTLATGFGLADAVKLNPDDAILPMVPLTSHLNLCCSIPASFVSGAALLISASKQAMDETLGWAGQEGASLLVGVPTNYIQLLQLFGPAKNRVPMGLRGIVAGSVCDEATVRAVRNRLNIQLCNHYGMSEFGGVSTVTLDDEDDEVVYKSTGRPFPWVETKIQRDGNGPGEILVRGPGCFRSALTHLTEMQKRISSDLWLHTGDHGSLGTSGEIQIAGRSGDMAIRGGNNVFFAEIETIFRESVGVDDVVAFSLSDPVLGERICVCIVPVQGTSLTVEEMFAFASSRLPAFKLPDYLGFVAKIETGPTGKVLRRSMRSMAVDGSFALWPRQPEQDLKHVKRAGNASS